MNRILSKHMKKLYPAFCPYSAAIPPENFNEFICLNCGGAKPAGSMFLQLEVGKVCFDCIENEFLFGTVQDFLKLCGLEKLDIYGLLWALELRLGVAEDGFFL